MPSDCDVTKLARTAELYQLQREAGQHLSTLLATIAVLKAKKDTLCTTGDPSYNPTCCSLYGAKVGGLPTGLENQLAMRISEANDAIAAIDCAGPNWQAQLAEADAKLQAVIDFDAMLRRLNAELTAWMLGNGEGCPINTPGGG